MLAVLLIARAEARRRLLSLTLLMLLVALVVTVVLASAAGARRSSTALDRFLHATAAHDASLSIYGTNPPDATERLRAVDGVAQVAVANFYVADAGTTFDFAVVSSPDGTAMSTMDRPLVVTGRMPADDAPDEVALNERAAQSLGKGPGDHLSLPTFDAAELAAYDGSTPFPGFDGPQLDLTVVGTVRLGDELQGAEGADGPVGLASPAFAAAQAGKVGYTTTIYLLRLTDPSMLPAVADAVKEMPIARYPVDVTSIDEEWVATARSAIDVVTVALAVFSAVAALAGLVAISQGVVRQLTLTADIVPTSTALGLTRRERAMALGLPSALAMVVGTVVGTVGAIAASPLFPLAVARRAEPRTGVQVDLAVLVGGAVVVMVLLGAWIFAIARRRAVPTAAPPSLAAGSSKRLFRIGPGATLAPQLGARLALNRDRSSRRLPVRTAIAGAVVAVVGVVGVGVFVTSLDDTIARPDRWGWTWSSAPDANGTDDPLGALDSLAAEPDLTAVGVLFTSPTEINGQLIHALTFDTIKGSIPPAVVAGRLPAGPGEVALGANTMRELGTDNGRSVMATTTPSEARPDREEVPLEVVGRVVVPLLRNLDPGTGAVVTPDAFARLIGVEAIDNLITGDPLAESNMVLRYRPDAQGTTLEERLAADHGLAYSAYSRPHPPGRLDNLRDVTPIAVLLGLFFALLGLVGLVHALLVSVRRRRGDFAVLKTFGMLHRQLRRIVVSQALTIMAVGLLIGIPVGVAVGRLTWTASVEDLGMVDPATTPAGLIALVATAALLTAALVALIPGWMASRRAPARALRSE